MGRGGGVEDEKGRGGTEKRRVVLMESFALSFFVTG